MMVVQRLKTDLPETDAIMTLIPDRNTNTIVLNVEEALSPAASQRQLKQFNV